MKTSPADILRAAHSLLVCTSWQSTHDAVNEGGVSVHPSDCTAVSFSAAGAIKRAAEFLCYVDGYAEEEAIVALARVVTECVPVEEKDSAEEMFIISDWEITEGRTHVDVVRMFERALKAVA